jgi:hypothetical protein
MNPLRFSKAMDWAGDDCDMALKRAEKNIQFERMIAFGLRFRISGGSDELC